MSDKSVRRWLVTGSVLFHVAALGGLAIAAMWRIDKLPINDHAGVVAAFEMPPEPRGGAPKAQVLKPKDPVVVKVKPPVITQPVVTQEQHVTTTQVAVSTTIGTGTGSGTGTGTGTGSGSASGSGTGSGSGSGSAAEAVVHKTVTKPPIITPADAKALRISGDDQIDAPGAVKVAMVHAGQASLFAAIRICISAGGEVDSVTILRSTGYSEYDQKLVDEMGTWQFHPYLKEGVATAACTVDTLRYVMR
jgi:TonB family protein